MKAVVPQLVVSVVIGAIAALAAAGISMATSGTLSPLGGGVLGLMFGVMAGNVAGPRLPAMRQIGPAVLRGVVAGTTAVLVSALLQR
jgi:hypothetical protein